MQHDLNGPGVGRPWSPNVEDDATYAWEFWGSSATEEVDSDVEEHGTGFDVLDDAPSDDDDVNDDGVNTSALCARDVMFDFSDGPLPPTIRLCVDKEKGYVAA